MKDPAEEYLDRLFDLESAAAAAEDLEDRQRLNALAGELYIALASRDFNQARRSLSKIRAEIKHQDWMPEPGSTKLKFKRSQMEYDVEFAALYLSQTLGRLPTKVEIYDKAQVLAKRKGIKQGYSELGVRKIIHRLRIPTAPDKRGPKRRVS